MVVGKRKRESKDSSLSESWSVGRSGQLVPPFFCRTVLKISLLTSFLSLSLGSLFKDSCVEVEAEEREGYFKWKLAIFWNLPH